MNAVSETSEWNKKTYQLHGNSCMSFAKNMAERAKKIGVDIEVPDIWGKDIKPRLGESFKCEMKKLTKDEERNLIRQEAERREQEYMTYRLVKPEAVDYLSLMMAKQKSREFLESKEQQEQFLNKHRMPDVPVTDLIADLAQLRKLHKTANREELIKQEAERRKRAAERRERENMYGSVYGAAYISSKVGNVGLNLELARQKSREFLESKEQQEQFLASEVLNLPEAYMKNFREVNTKNNDANEQTNKK